MEKRTSEVLLVCAYNKMDHSVDSTSTKTFNDSSKAEEYFVEMMHTLFTDEMPYEPGEEFYDDCIEDGYYEDDYWELSINSIAHISYL